MNPPVPSATDTWYETLGNTGVVAACGAILVVVISAYLTARSSRATQRRERYAAMVSTLAAWIELPYQIRRRRSDSDEVIGQLSERAHQLQQQMVIDGAELWAECPWLARRYDLARSTIQAAASPFLTDAWSTTPSPESSSMILGGWGPVGLDAEVVAWTRQLPFRFGWRRLANPVRLGWQRVRPSARPPSVNADFEDVP